ncbi:MAG: hypothetical protein CL666_01340 [Balneola sp.]|nr:hypothetical protein [Balneola sp.]
MRRIVWIKVLKNLVLLALVVLPIFFVFVWIQSLLQQATGATEIAYVMETGGVYYLSNVIPVLVGGLIHQLLLTFLPRELESTKYRIVAFFLTLIIPMVVWLLWGGPVKSFLLFAVPMILALGVYALLIRIPVKYSPSE